MKTRYTIMRPEEPNTGGEIDWPREPTFDQIDRLVRPLLNGASLEHVSVLADFKGGLNFKRADMFVDESGAMKDLPINGNATAIYRRHSIINKGAKADDLPAIHGPAILFERIVWY